MTISFKPEFGNHQHAKIAEMIGDLEGKKRKLREKKSAAVYFTGLKKDIEGLEKEIIRLISQENEKYKNNVK